MAESTLSSEPMTAGQRRALFATARRLGLDIDQLRDATPGGSISMLTRAQAAELLNRLNGRPAAPVATARRPRRAKRVYAMATPAQHRKIEAVRIDLGWTAEQLRDFLAGRHHADGRPMTSIDSTRDGRDVIQLLLYVLSRTRKDGAAAGDAPSLAEAT